MLSPANPQIAVHRASDASNDPRLKDIRNLRASQDNPQLFPPSRGGGGSHRNSASGRSAQGSAYDLLAAASANLQQRLAAPFIRDESINIQWRQKPRDGAPELSLLSKRTSHSDETVVARTDKTLEFVGDVLQSYTVLIKYGPGAGSIIRQKTSASSLNSKRSKNATKHAKSAPHSSNNQRKKVESHAVSPSLNINSHSHGSNSSNAGDKPGRVKYMLLRDFYEKADRSITVLEQCVNHFKNMIFALTFTKYSEQELTESEVKQTRGKTIVGSCIWIVIYALQQLQEDPEIQPVESQPKPHGGLHELAQEMQTLLTLCLVTWNELVISIDIMEKMHRKTEELFHKQTLHFQSTINDSETANVASVHIKKYRRSDDDLQELKNLKAFDPYASLLSWSRRTGPSRILYKTEYSKLDSLWNGFDPLSVDKKVGHLRDVVNFVRLILESVKDSAQKIITDLQGRGGPATLSPIQQSSSGSLSYEEGIEAMDVALSKKLLNLDWKPDEVHEFFETDKIFLDQMDLLTLGAGVARAILHEARHMMHICYETSRLLDFKEFLNLPAYERLYHRMKDEFVESRTHRKLRKVSVSSNPYDIEEIHVELRNVAGLFRTSTYHEILKNIPVYTNRLGLTLQDAELVFSPSSEKLLRDVTFKSMDD